MSEKSDKKIRIIQFSGIFTLIIFLPYYYMTIEHGVGIPRDGTSLVVGRDFLNGWMYGRAAWIEHPGLWYDPHLYGEALRQIVGPGYPDQNWSYPPSIMLPMAPFGRLPYIPALLLWTIMGVCAFIAALRLWAPRAALILPAVLAPASVFGMMSGQYMFLVAAAILSALHWRETRPVLAGILIGLLTLKPQVGLLFPVLLVATRNWRAFVAATLTTLMLAGATALIWGVDVWVRYWTIGLPTQSLAVWDADGTQGPFAPTLFSNLHGAGIPPVLAMAAQLVAAIGAAGLVWLRFRERPQATDLRANALFLACSVAAAPYLLSYDLLALSCVAILLVAASGENRLLLLLVFFLPLIQMICGAWHVPGPAAIPLVLAAAMMRRPICAEMATAA